MFAENETNLEETSQNVFSEAKKSLKESDEIKRTGSGSVDTEYYIKHCHEQRSCGFLKRIKAIFT